MTSDLSIGPAPKPAPTQVQGSGVKPSAPPPEEAATPARTAQVDPEVVEAKRVKALLTDPGVRVSTHRDDPSGHVVMTVQDRRSGQVVEQFPSEKMLRLFTALRESLIDEQA